MPFRTLEPGGARERFGSFVGRFHLGSKVVVVTADDFGYNDEICHGIEIGFTQGLITEASLISTAPSRDLAIQIAQRNPGLGVGCHLTLQEFPPFTSHPFVASLRYKSNFVLFVRILFATRKQLSSVIAEMHQQIDWIRNQGITISHLNGHNHFHMHFRLLKRLHALAHHHQIRWVRITEPGFRHQLRRSRLFNKILIGITSFLANQHLGLRATTTDSFYGFGVSGNLTREQLLSYLTTCKEGISEIMCHVGTSNQVPMLTGYQWADELEALTSMSKFEAENAFNISIANFSLCSAILEERKRIAAGLQEAQLWK
ncbi:MAG: ChbG/HpnK family deacetylase [Actinobacteria bacterium]|nr:MAG: ChbG/HpnK family deacetylase [Actinomycetota bacterium]